MRVPGSVAWRSSSGAGHGRGGPQSPASSRSVRQFLATLAARASLCLPDVVILPRRCDTVAVAAPDDHGSRGCGRGDPGGGAPQGPAGPAGPAGPGDPGERAPAEEAAARAGARLLADLLAALEPVADAAMADFYSHLFVTQPQTRAMFPPAMDTQRQRFYRALSRIIAGQEEPRELAAYLTELGRAHRKFGVTREHYDGFGRALADTLRRYARGAWTPTMAAAWDEAYGHAAGVMIAAAERDAAHAPPWWLAEVTAHERRGSDLAVLTLAPGQPVHYLPGQHVSVQTPHWPRLWRDYSVANAPREDGTLRLHVRAVPGGLVSTALVHRTAAGDTLLLGAPAGSMTAEAAAERDVLCLAGGTGLAPIKAIIESIIGAAGPAQSQAAATAGTARAAALAGMAGWPREIVLYLGARRASAFYDLACLRVIPVVSEEPARGMLSGTIPGIVADAPWQDRDIYISGPDEMITKTVRELKRLGAPGELIHYDTHPF